MRAGGTRPRAFTTGENSDTLEERRVIIEKTADAVPIVGIFLYTSFAPLIKLIT